MRQSAAAVVGLILVSLAAGATEEEPPADLRRALRALSTAAEHEANLTPEFRQALGDVIEALQEQAEVANTSPTAVSATPVPRERGFLDRLHAFGDVRLRYEHERGVPDRDDRNRARLRFRVGAEYELLDDLAAGFRIRTGDPDDPNSPHQTLGQMFDSFEINLDQLYLRYAPRWIEDATSVTAVVTGGKFANPFQTNPVYGELVWDADVNPEGLAVVLGRAVGDSVTLRVTPAIYSLEEQAGGDDASLVAVQGSVAWQSGDWSARAASGWYRYLDLTPDGSDFSVRDNAGNLVGPDLSGNGVPDDFLSRFSIIDTSLSFSWTGWRYPITLAGEVWTNTEAVNDDDTGFAVGLTLGDGVNERHDWRTFYQYQRVEQESLFSGVAQDDFPLSTNFSGHVFGLEYGLARGIGLRGWALLSEALETGGGGAFADDSTQARIRLDLNARF